MAHDEQWLTPRLQTAATLCNQTPAATESPLWLGVDLGTCDVVSMVVDRDGQPVAVCLDWADVVRDGIVWDFFGAVTIVRRHLDTLEQQFGLRFSHAATSFPPGTDPRISINVLESAGLEVSHVLDEPTAVADLLQLDNAGVDTCFQFCFCINAMVSIQILSKFWCPDCLQFTSLSNDWFALKFQVNFWNVDISTCINTLTSINTLEWIFIFKVTTGTISRLYCIGQCSCSCTSTETSYRTRIYELNSIIW